MEEYADDHYNDEVVEEYDDDKWHGVPPAGETPIESKGKFLLGIVGVLLVEFTLWGIYRFTTKDFYGPGFNIPFFIGHIIAAPTLALIPILGYWKFIRKESIFLKTDYENGKFMSFNFGPFKLTKKRLASAVIVGLIGGFIWRVTEMLSDNFSSSVLGGSKFFSFHLMDVFAIDTATGWMDWPTFLLMTFVMFFIVGPVEEFQFRSFAHDQSQRVLPKWAALIFSSVFFGLSHMPIALFIYTQEPYNATGVDILFMQIGWMTAGATFGALYMWSRNIYACIVMHGIGNWQLSVFWIANLSTETGLTGTSIYLSSLFVSIFANGFMILLFFLIHKYYWEPQRKGEAAFGGRLLPVQKFLFSHDNGSRNGAITGVGLAGATLIFLVLIFSTTSIFGFDSYDVLTREGGESTPNYEFDLEQYITVDETQRDSMYLSEDETSEYMLNSTNMNVIQRIRIVLQWTDESEMPANRIRPYDNQPDTFNVSVTGDNISQSSTTSNPIGGSGTITLTVDIDKDYINEVTGMFNISVVVTMQEADMWVPSFGPGIIGLTDSGNEYSINMEITRLRNEYYEPEPEPEEEDEEVPEDGDIDQGMEIFTWDRRWYNWPTMI